MGFGSYKRHEDARIPLYSVLCAVLLDAQNDEGVLRNPQRMDRLGSESSKYLPGIWDKRHIGQRVFALERLVPVVIDDFICI